MYRLFERLFAIILLLTSMNVVAGFTDIRETDAAVVSTNLHLPVVVAQIVLYIWCALLIVPRWRRTFAALKVASPLLAIVALSLASTAWSVDPGMTLRRSVFLAATTVMAVYLGERYSLEEFGKIFTQALCILLVGSILTYFVAPARVLDVSHTNAWRGLANHKNSFGECMALAVLLLLSIRFNAFRWLRIVLLIGAVGLLYLSHSSAAVAACAVVVAIMPMWRIVSAKRRNGWIVSILIGTMVVVCIALVTMNREMILTLLGHDSTLSGRVQLWEEVGKAILTHPILGYGYEAFWEGFKGVSRNILLETGWLVPMAHNGYLELMLSMGITGLLLFLVIFFRSFKLALHYVRSNSRPGALWPISFLCFFALHNLAESTLLTRQTFQFLVFAVILTSLLGQEWKEEADARCAASETRARSFNTLPNLATDRSVN